MKEKISITLDSRIVEKIEKISNQQRINRSKFIENILIEKLESTPALILAAWSDYKNKPKSLLKYNNKHLVVRQIQSIQQQGFKNIFITISSEELKKYIEKNFPEVQILFETEPLGSGGSLKKFAKTVDQRFLYIHCDIVTEIDFNKLIDFHLKEKPNITLVLKTNKNPSKYGTVTLEGNKIIDFEEKPSSSNIFLIYTGIGIAEPNAFEKVDGKGKLELEVHKINKKIGYIYEGFWKNITKDES